MTRSREEVVAVVAHDLRTPLQVLSLSAVALQREVGEKHQRVVGRMVAAVDAMTNMAHGLLSTTVEVAPSGTGRTVLASSALVRDAMEMMGPIAERAGQRLVLGAVESAAVRVDYSHLLRVLGNLIGNAIKYSPTGTAITVSAQRDGSEVHLTVADHGRGMTSVEQSQAFEQGWQGIEGMARGDGVGLGLAIVRRLVTEHGGTVKLTSALGVGTTVTVSLPCEG